MEFEFILYVADQERSTDFYCELLQQTPSLNVPGMTEFTLSPHVKLGLMPESGIQKILNNKVPAPTQGNGIPRCELYLKYSEIKLYCDRALKLNAVVISDALPRDWGDTVAYFADPDGHIIALAEKTVK